VSQLVEAHFELRGLFAVAVSSVEHGYMKPHRSIFEAALRGAESTHQKPSWWATA
jgi:FMN phosphatase YigB (HAD superfamily)